MQLKKLPIGRATFSEIRDPGQNCIYIDKTKEAHLMVNSSKYFFLSRPRRFGKSLFLDTLSEIFKGNKALFEGLYIYDKYDWGQSFPVVKIDFTGGSLSTKEFIDGKVRHQLRQNAEDHGVPFERINDLSLGNAFGNLINQLSKKYGKKVVVLIDEYDKPIIDNIGVGRKEVAMEAREILRGFYAALKAGDSYLRFVFMTGVSKFSKLNLFSGLNNIQDITLHKDFTTITGYTQADLELHFADYLHGVDLEAVRRWYNGYNYFGEPIYNPYDILLFLSNGGEFRNYWWQTGNPQFLVDKLKEGNYFLPDLETVTVSEETLNAFDVERIDLVALLWQTGYLTFDKKIQQLEDVAYRMKVPNLEVQKSLNALFYDYLTSAESAATPRRINILGAMLDRDFQLLESELRSLFASIPYQNYVNNTMANFEGYYASVMYAFMSSLGFQVFTEDATNLGRVDMALVGPNEVIVMEFKVDMPTEAALQQIKSKKYHQKYLDRNKEIYLVGIHFSSHEKNIAAMEWERYS